MADEKEKKVATAYKKENEKKEKTTSKAAETKKTVAKKTVEKKQEVKNIEKYYKVRYTERDSRAKNKTQARRGLRHACVRMGYGLMWTSFSALGTTAPMGTAGTPASAIRARSWGSRASGTLRSRPPAVWGS